MVRLPLTHTLLPYRRSSDLGFTCYTHPEIEFYLFEQATDPEAPLVPVDTAGYFDHVVRGTAHDFRRAAITMLESMRSEEHTSELQSRGHLVCRLRLEKKKKV